MNRRHALCSSEVPQKWNLRKNVSKPLNKDEDKAKLVERLENLEKDSHYVDEVKADLIAIKGLLGTANAAIDELKTELASTKEELNNFKTMHKDQLQVQELELAKLKKDLQPKVNKEDPQPKENKQVPQPKLKTQNLQPKENKAENEEIEKQAELEVDDSLLNVDLHNAYAKLPYDSLDELKTFTEDLSVLATYNHLVSDIHCPF